MKPNQQNSRNGSPPRPWAAIAIGAFLSIFGVVASTYGFIAVTWSGDTNSQVVHVSPPESLPLRSETEDAIDIDDADRPVRTSTTRRRGTTRSATKAPKSVPTTVEYEPDLSQEDDVENESVDDSEAADEDNIDYDQQNSETADETSDELGQETDTGESPDNGGAVADPVTPEPTE